VICSKMILCATFRAAAVVTFEVVTEDEPHWQKLVPDCGFNRRQDLVEQVSTILGDKLTS